MNRLFTIFCMVSLLVFHTSCNDSVMDLENPSVEMKTRAVDQRVQNLIQQARQGDVEAYNSLALCYRDGDGVEKSWLNMICMYAIYCQKTGGDIEDVVELFEKEHPFILLFEIMDSPSFNEEVEAKLEQLRQSAPAEAKAIEAAKKAFSMEEAASALSTIREAEAEGSELAGLLQIIYHEEKRDTAMYRQCLLRMADKHPMLNAKIAQLYETRYVTDDDFPYVLKAIEYYYKADSCGMLTPRQANHLWSIYDYFGKKGLLEYDETEVERLKKIIK